MAYNLVNWFKRLCLPPALEPMTLVTLRTRFFLAPAQLIRTDNRPTLKLPRNFLYQDAWDYAFKQIDQFYL